MKSCKSTLAIILFGLAQASLSLHAEEPTTHRITQTFSLTSPSLIFADQPLNVARFDTTLGTLAEIEFIIKGTVTTTLTFINVSTSRLMFNASIGGGLTLSNLTRTVVYNDAIPYSTSASQSVNAGGTFQKTTSSSSTSFSEYSSTGTLVEEAEDEDDPGLQLLNYSKNTSPAVNISEFIGPGNITLYLSGTSYYQITSTTGGLITINNAVQTGVTQATVQVVYEYLPIPEPSTRSMMILGGACVLFVVWRKRRPAQEA